MADNETPTVPNANAGQGAPATADVYGKPYVHDIDDAVISALNAIGLDVTEFTPSGAPEFMTEAKGPKGMVTAILRCTEKKIDVNVSGFILDQEDFDAAKDFDLEGRLFIISKDSKKFVGGEFAKGEFTATSWPLVTRN